MAAPTPPQPPLSGTDAARTVLHLSPVAPRAAPPGRHVLLGPGVVLGAALGGMLDGIVLHQVLQLHSMLSSVVSRHTVEGMHVNMLADGLFHGAMWLLLLLGIAWLVGSLQRGPVAGPGRALWGAGLMGWGLFNLVEGLVNHQWLGLHHVLDMVPDPWPADAAFLLSGVLLMAGGAWLYHRRRR